MNQKNKPGMERVSDPEEEWDEALVWQQRGLIGGEKEEGQEGAWVEIQGNVKPTVINH